MIKKYWLAFVIVYLLMVHVLGGAIYTDYAFAFGNLLVAAIIGGLVIYRAKSPFGVRVGHLTQFAIGLYLIGIAYSDAREGTYGSFVTSCKGSSNFSTAMISEDEKSNYCNCMAELMVDDLMKKGALAALFFQELAPIEENLSLQKDINAAAMTCGKEF